MGEEGQDRTTDRAERYLIQSIVSETYPPHSDLPGERTLAKELGLARPALREAMQRLSRDGWLDIQQGKPTRIRDYLKDGNLNILSGLLKADPDLVPNLVPNLLEMWELLAPDYTASSVRRAPGLILDLLESFNRLPDEPEAYTESMWELHHTLIAYCDNLVYGLIFNTFKDFYHQLARYYYTEPSHRQMASDLWEGLAEPIRKLDTDAAAVMVRAYVSRTKEFWQNISIDQYQDEVLSESHSKAKKVKDGSKKKKKSQ